MDEGFSFLIDVRLIRDNWKAVIGNDPTSLIGEILFDLQDKQLLGIILLPLFVKFGLIYRIWAFILALYLGDVIKGLLLVLGSFWACVLGLRTYYFKPHAYARLVKGWGQLMGFEIISAQAQDASLKRD